MPLVLLQYRPGRGLDGLAAQLAQELPNIVAPALNVNDQREDLDGRVTPKDILVRLIEGGLRDVNTKDLEIIIWAHDFPERMANLEERKEAILAGVRRYFDPYHSNNPAVSGFVWILLQPSAYGQL